MYLQSDEKRERTRRVAVRVSKRIDRSFKLYTGLNFLVLALSTGILYLYSKETGASLIASWFTALSKPLGKFLGVSLIIFYVSGFITGIKVCGNCKSLSYAENLDDDFALGEAVDKAKKLRTVIIIDLVLHLIPLFRALFVFAAIIIYLDFRKSDFFEEVGK